MVRRWRNTRVGLQRRVLYRIDNVESGFCSRSLMTTEKKGWKEEQDDEQSSDKE